MGAGKIGQDAVDAVPIKFAHKLNAKPPHPVRLVEQRGDDQQPPIASAIADQRHLSRGLRSDPCAIGEFGQAPITFASANARKAP